MKSSLILKIFTVTGFLTLITLFVSYRAGLFGADEETNGLEIETTFSNDQPTEYEEPEMMPSSKSMLIPDKETELIPSSQTEDILGKEKVELATKNPDSMRILNEHQIISSSKTIILTDDYLKLTRPWSVTKPSDSQTTLPTSPASSLSRKK